MRTRLSICAKKASYTSEEQALSAARRFGLPLLPYRCDRCRLVHLTSRTKGKRIPRPGAAHATVSQHSEQASDPLVANKRYSG